MLRSLTWSVTAPNCDQGFQGSDWFKLKFSVTQVTNVEKFTTEIYSESNLSLLRTHKSCGSEKLRTISQIHRFFCYKNPFITITGLRIAKKLRISKNHAQA